ncbi:3-carboxy-cis,cis-muconate cycloisomerase [Sneathiella sp. P13V-1]|uniref:3-carboxy-cis,cis-muconate cycloisomerase n=1 Tax=Sneathiella sp. P13V-1 TaxID=2697366 RepID=UPI00187BB59C|nr:3-carboxy-cis,cis-muconate cycloisomerase [Sneathiella sp. P13V-1]MBE7636802.1 3-carboxy-cis,cis-muconate cycloisomerase [Sneathiella sp. P13V-1]
MTVSVFEHPYLKELLGNEAVSAFFSVEADVKAMLQFEAALAKVEAAQGIITAKASEAISVCLGNFTPDLEQLNSAVARDGVVVPELIRQIRVKLPVEFQASLHFGATSQDVIDTSLVLRLNKAILHLLGDFDVFLEKLAELNTRFGDREIMGRTRMQRALPIPVSHRIDAWRRPLERLRRQAETLIEEINQLQFGGAVGTLDKLGAKGADVRNALARELGLNDPGYCWHTDRTTLINLVNWLNLVAGGLGKIGQDVIQMSVNEVREVYLIGGGSSSAMPHKQNPVLAEILVSLAHFIGVNSSAMQHVMQHENERSGSSWTLEWMTVPQIVVSASASLKNGIRLLDQIEDIPDMAS